MHLMFYNREYLNRQLWCTFFLLWFKKKGRRKAFDLGERTKEKPFVNIFIPPLHSGKIPKNNLTESSYVNVTRAKEVISRCFFISLSHWSAFERFPGNSVYPSPL